MPTTDNGWSASPSLNLRPLVIDGVAFVPGIRDDDDVHTVLSYVLGQFHKRVEQLHNPGCWGFAYRENRNNPNSLSRHSGGIAVDANAPAHPNGVATSRTFTQAEIAEVHQILAEVDHIVRWGGDYNGTPDAMHFEIDVPPNSPALAEVADRIRNQEDDMFEPADRKLLTETAAAVNQLARDERRRNIAGIARVKKLRAKIARGEDLADVADDVDEILAELQADG